MHQTCSNFSTSSFRDKIGGGGGVTAYESFSTSSHNNWNLPAAAFFNKGLGVSSMFLYSMLLLPGASLVVTLITVKVRTCQLELEAGMESLAVY